MEKIKPKRIVSLPLSEEVKQQIVDRWKSGKKNAIPEIAADFNTSLDRVSNIINNHIKSLIIKNQ